MTRARRHHSGGLGLTSWAVVAWFTGAVAQELGPIPQAPISAGRSLTAGMVAAPLGAGLAPVDLSSRETARVFFQTVYAASETPAPVWTGDYATCAPGSSEPDYRDRVALRINYYRAMAGVPAAITFLEQYNEPAQAAAFLMSRNRQLSHAPPPTWLCYSEDGAAAAAKSNLALGRVGPGAIDSYLQDYGEPNRSVGHRRWLLYPQTRQMGSGDVPGEDPYPPANATWIIDDYVHSARPATREEYVAWPPPGFVPYPVVFPRWSFALSQADFRDTVVTLRSNGVPVAVTLEPVQGGAGENTVVWHAAGANTTTPSDWPRPLEDTLYEVTLDPVFVGGTPRRFAYSVMVFDPAQSGPDTVLPGLQGPLEPVVGAATAYTFNAVPVASGHEWLAGTREHLAVVEGAEGGLGRLVASISPGYDPVTTAIRASGTRSFHLAHPVPNTDQTLTWDGPLLCSAASELRFREYLGIATSTQVGKVEVSLDDGSSWNEAYAHPGPNGDGVVAFRTTAVPLGQFAERLVRVRFNYHHAGGAHYAQTEAPVGWYLDDITFQDTQEVGEVNVREPLTATSFAFTPAQAGAYVLAVRGRFQDRYALEWGPALAVTAGTSSGPVISFVGVPVLSGGQVQMDFTVSGGEVAPTFQLERAVAPIGPWEVEPEAGFSTVQPGVRFRVFSPDLGRTRGFFRVRTP